MRVAGVVALAAVMTTATAYSFRRTLDEMDRTRVAGMDGMSLRDQLEQAVRRSQMVGVTVHSVSGGRSLSIDNARLFVGVRHANGTLRWVEFIPLDRVAGGRSSQEVAFPAGPGARIVLALGPLSSVSRDVVETTSYDIDGGRYAIVAEKAIGGLREATHTRGRLVSSAFAASAFGLRGELRYRVGIDSEKG